MKKLILIAIFFLGSNLYAIPFADVVLDTNLPNGQAQSILGAPDSVFPSGSFFFGNFVTLGFTDNVIIDGVGNDFEIKVFDHDTVEDFETFVSFQGSSFVSLGVTPGVGGNPTIGFDLQGSGVSQVDAIRLEVVDSGSVAGQSGFSPDAITSLNFSAPTPAVPELSSLSFLAISLFLLSLFRKNRL